MGILLIIGMMVYSAALCWLFQWIDTRSSRVPDLERQPGGSPGDVVVPDRVPREWVEAFHAEQGD